MCVCVYVCVYVCMYVCMYVYMYVYMCVCVCVCVLLYLFSFSYFDVIKMEIYIYVLRQDIRFSRDFWISGQVL